MRRALLAAVLFLVSPASAGEISNPGVDCTIQDGVNNCGSRTPVLLCDTACTQLIEDTTSVVLIESN